MIQKFVPPVIAKIYLKYIKKQKWKGKYPSWAAAQKQCVGYDADIIFEKAKRSILEVRNGNAVYERDTVVFDKIEYSWQVLAGLMMVAANHEGKLNVIDFGGALGSSYFQNRRFLNELKFVQWNIVEQAHFVKFGQQELATDCLRFYSSIQECFENTQPNVLLLSNVIQYIESYKEVLDVVNNTNVDYVIIDMLPIDMELTFEDASICVQRVSPQIYEASYPCRIFRENLISQLLTKYKEIESFENSLQIYVNTHEVKYQGFIFKRNDK